MGGDGGSEDISGSDPCHLRRPSHAKGVRKGVGEWTNSASGVALDFNMTKFRPSSGGIQGCHIHRVLIGS